MRRREFIKNAAVGLTALAAGRTHDANATRLGARRGGARRSPEGRGRSGKGSRYRVAVIGRTGQGNYGHGLDVVWNEIDQTEVVAVADRDSKGRAAAARWLKAPRAYADYRKMLEKERPQIVSVAPRWLDCHHEMVLACADFGCHVFLEKPMCQSLEQADEMVAAPAAVRNLLRSTVFSFVILFSSIQQLI